MIRDRSGETSRSLNAAVQIPLSPTGNSTYQPTITAYQKAILQKHVPQDSRSSRRRRVESRGNVCNISHLVYHLIGFCRKQVSFEEGKVVLYRLGNKIHATSAYCTHYGASLVKGVLTADGRVVWYAHISPIPVFFNAHVLFRSAHGTEVSRASLNTPFLAHGTLQACFNVCTGDIGGYPCYTLPPSPDLSDHRGRTCPKPNPLLHSPRRGWKNLCDC